MTRFVLACGFVTLFLCLPPKGFAEAEAPPAPWSIPWLQQAAEQAKQQSQRLRQRAQGLGADLAARWTERATLVEELEILYRRNITSLNRKESLAKEKQLASASLDKVPLPAVGKANLRDLDRLLDQKQAAENQLDSLRLEVKVARSALEHASSNFQRAKQQTRSFLDRQKTASTKGESLWIQQGLELKQKIAQAGVKLARSRLDNLKFELEFRRQTAKQLSQRVTQVRERLAFDPEDLASHLKEIAQKQKALRARQRSLRKEQREIETAWVRAQDELKRGRHPDYLKRAQLLLSTREAWRDTYQKVLEQTEVLLSWATQEEHLWRWRYALLGSKPSSKDLGQWSEEINASLVVLDRQIQLAQTEQTRLQSEQLAVPDTSGMGKFETQVIQNQRRAIGKLIERGLEFQTRLQSVKALHLRTLEEIHRFKKGLKLTEKIGAVSSQAWQVWDLELWVIDDKPVTLKKAVFALVLFIFGFIGAKRITLAFRRRLLPSLDLDESSAATTEKIFHYFLIFLLVLMTLNLVNIPLTAFTFLGGAVAIAFGFGAQNLLNNFISGFIIMAERPIKIGDMIEMEDKFGIIEEIGARCTRIRTPTNVHVLVPNSAFLEKNITNWTLSNMQVRAHINVGVAYGSDVQKVRELLLQVAAEHERISFEPRPEVFFKDFGDNALHFAIYFSLTLQNLMDRYRIQSDVRFAIYQAFQEAGITIAFPQRDLHLVDSAELNVRIVKPT